MQRDSSKVLQSEQASKNRLESLLAGEMRQGLAGEPRKGRDISPGD